MLTTLDRFLELFFGYKFKSCNAKTEVRNPNLVCVFFIKVITINLQFVNRKK